LLGQEESDEEPFSLEVDYDTPLTIDLEGDEEEEVVEPKKKKRKRNVFYGFKTKKGYNKIISGDDVTLEFFSYLKEFEQPDPFVRDIYWYDFRRRKVMNSRRIDTRYGVILHGPYRKSVGDQVLEEGIFYIGTKHGRWVRHDKNDVLLDKEKYYKGWPKESKVTYYDRDRLKLKEVIPVEHGEKEGYYYYFHENGAVAVIGEYRFDARVGTWNEYYDFKNKRKRQVRYPEDPFDEESKSYILKEWNLYGKVIYDHTKEF